ncbi:hypothetical protein C4J97_3645 [Pseudomonas orientalis]|nr:hypothetical protein C4J97_3645 [Pseudomonas orientalis]
MFADKQVADIRVTPTISGTVSELNNIKALHHFIDRPGGLTVFNGGVILRKFSVISQTGLMP